MILRHLHFHHWWQVSRTVTLPHIRHTSTTHPPSSTVHPLCIRFTSMNFRHTSAQYPPYPPLLVRLWRLWSAFTRFWCAFWRAFPHLAALCTGVAPDGCCMSPHVLFAPFGMFSLRYHIPFLSSLSYSLI